MYSARLLAGRFLAKDSPVDADIVVGVPESGNAAAQGYAMESGIPYGTEINFAFRPDLIHLFDPETEKNLMY